MKTDQIARSEERPPGDPPTSGDPEPITAPSPALAAIELRRNRTRAATASRVELERQLAIAKREQVEAMRAQHEGQDSWVAIGQAANMTATAAMYATGHAVRTPRRKAASD